jgi:hypothetical protein
LFTKHADGWYGYKGGKAGEKVTGNMATWIEGFTTSVVPPGVEKPEAVPVVIAPKIEWKAAADLIAKTEKAKAVAEWAKKYQPVSDPQTLRVLAHMQQLAPDIGFWVRQAPGADKILVGSDNPEFSKFWKSLGAESAGTKTPLGTFQRVTVDDLVAALPGAQSMVGPDGQKYPVGTTFESTQKHTTVKDTIAALPGFYKWADHKTDSALQVLKVKGTGPEQVETAKGIAAKVGLTIPEPKLGGSSTLVFFQKTDIDKVVSTETIVVPTLPPQPPVFHAKGLPIGGAALGELAPVNRADLGVITGIKLGQAGHAIRMGKYGIFQDGQIYARRVRDVNGKSWIELSGILENKNHVPKMATGAHRYFDSAHTDIPGYEYKQHTYDAEADAHLESEEIVAAYEAYVGKTLGGSPVSLIKDASKPAWNRTFSIRIPESSDIEKETAHAMEVLGLDVAAAMAEPDAEDVRKSTKLVLARALGGPQTWHVLDYKEQILDEKWLDAQIKGHESKVASMEWRWVGPGRQAPVLEDQEAAKNAGVGFLYVGVSGAGSVIARLKEGFMASNQRKRQMGVKGNAASAGQDEDKGGSFSVFMRFGNVHKAGHSWGYKCSGIKLVFHPRLVNRLDWYAHNDDVYGSTRHGTTGRYDSLEYDADSNEVSFRDTVSLRDLAGIVVHSEAEREQLLDLAKKAGLDDTVNGIPLKQFITVYSGGSRNQIAEQVVGLQEGVLP